MTTSSGPRLRRAIGLAVSAVLAVGLLGGASAAATTRREPLRVLQMNLCDSGIAECYTGRSVAQAAAVIRTGAPDVVTLNEVCRDDVAALGRVLASAHPADTVVSAFRAAGDRRAPGQPFRCRNGQPYGIGLLAAIPGLGRGYTTYSGTYPAQDRADPEERVWLCLDGDGRFYACATHLASTSRTVALAQCVYLLDKVVPAVRARGGGYQPTVLGGDLNLAATGRPSVRGCVPRGYLHAGDGGVQYVIATTDFTVGLDRSIAMHGATDHPGLLVALTAWVPQM
jgi:hypothetical protein